MPPAYPLINGVAYSFASVTVKVAGEEYLGVSSLSYNDSLTPGRLAANHPVPYGATRGAWEGDGSMEMFLADAHVLMNALGDGWGEVPVTITAAFAEEGQDNHIHILVARLSRGENTNTAGSDPSKMTFNLFLLSPIERDGKRIVRMPKTAGVVAQ